MSCCGQKARQCGSASEEWKLRGYLGGGRVVLHHEQMVCVRAKLGQMQDKGKTFFKWKGTVILGKSPKSLIPPLVV